MRTCEFPICLVVFKRYTILKRRSANAEKALCVRIRTPTLTSTLTFVVSLSLTLTSDPDMNSDFDLNHDLVFDLRLDLVSARSDSAKSIQLYIATKTAHLFEILKYKYRNPVSHIQHFKYVSVYQQCHGATGAAMPRKVRINNCCWAYY